MRRSQLLHWLSVLLALALMLTSSVTQTTHAQPVHSCGNWEPRSTSLDSRISALPLTKVSGDDCHGSIRLINGTALVGSGGYTLELKLASSGLGSHWWVPGAVSDPSRNYLIPSIDFLELHAIPKDTLADARIILEGDPTLKSFQVDLSIFLLKTLLAFSPTDCFIPDEQLIIASIRVAYVLESTAKLTIKMDSSGAVDELLTIGDEYFRLSSGAFREMGIDCGFEFLRQFVGSPVIMGQLVAEFLIWYPVIFIDMFRYKGVAATMSMVYAPDQKAVNWAKMEANWGKDEDAATAALEEIMKIDPNYRETRQKLYSLLVGKGDRLWGSGQCDAGRSALVRAQEVDPNRPEAPQMLAIPNGIVNRVTFPDGNRAPLVFNEEDFHAEFRDGNPISVQLYPKSSSNTSIDEQVSRFKASVVQRYLSTGLDICRYKIEWVIKPDSEYAPPAISIDWTKVNWSLLVASDPTLDATRQTPFCNYGEIDIVVRYKPDPSVVGYLWPTRAQFGDLDGDGVAEALVPLLQSCTGGAEKSLIFQSTPRGARVLAVGPGSGRAIDTKIVDGLIETTEAIYRPGEAGCCPTGGTRVTRFQLKDGNLIEARS